MVLLPRLRKATIALAVMSMVVLSPLTAQIQTINSNDNGNVSRNKINSNFSYLQTNKVAKFTGAGVPGSIAASRIGDIYVRTGNNTSYQCFASSGPCTAVASGNWQLIGSGGSSVTLQTNTVSNSSQSTLNLLNSSATNGITLTVTNTSGGNVQLGISGTLNNAGLTNSATTVNGQTCTLGSTCTVTAVAAAGTLTGTTLASNVVTSSLTSFGNSPTIVTPTIASFTNATHNHSNAAGGGTFNTVNASTCTGTPSAATYLRGDCTWSSPSGSGDVVGPGSATDNAIVRFDSTTGKLIKNSVVTLSDTTGDLVSPGTAIFGNASGNAGAYDMVAGTVQSVPANSFGWGVGTTMTTSVRLQSPNAAPTANSVMLFGAPSSNVATWTYASVPIKVGAGTKALATNSIASAACEATQTLTLTGLLSTDMLLIVPNASIKAVTGYTATTDGGLSIVVYPDTDAAKIDVCNWTANSITPGAVTLNLMGLR